MWQWKLALELQRAANLTINLYGTDVLITQALIQILIEYETHQRGLAPAHSEDKDYIQIKNQYDL